VIAKDGPIELAADLLDKYLATLRRALPYATTQAPEGVTTAWPQRRREIERVEEMKRAIEEAEKALPRLPLLS
jgi:hypothetical protein